MSSTTLDFSGDLRARRHAAAAARSGAAGAAEDALGRLFEAARQRHASQEGDAHREPPSEGLSAIAATVIDVLRDVPWRKAMLVLVGLALITACGVPAFVYLTRPRPPCPLHPVRGRVVFGKTVPEGARITLTPKEGGWPYDAFPTATVATDGSFRFGTFGRDDGVPAGTYVATVQWFRVAPDGSVGGNVLPKKYASAATSPLAVSVGSGPHDLPPLQITH